MNLYAIPALYCPFVGAIHPMYKEIEAHTNEWILEFQLTPTYEIFSRYKDYRFPLFIARSFPLGDYTDICAWCDLNTLLFMVDDIFDEKDIIRDKAAYMDFERQFMEILEYNKKCFISKDGPVLAALSDVWRRMALRTNKAWQKKFIRCITLMFKGLAWQFRHMISGLKPDLDEYMQIRQYLGAAHLSTDSLEVTGRIYLNEHVYEHPIVRKLTETSRNIVCFSNDLFSLSKELNQVDKGEYNLVTVLKNKYHISMEEAIQRAAQIHDDLVREFILLSEMVYLFDDRTNALLKKYIEALGYQMRGNVDWSTRETTRYPHISMN